MFNVKWGIKRDEEKYYQCYSYNFGGSYGERNGGSFGVRES